MRYFILLLLCICVCVSQTWASIAGHISTSDQDRLKVSLEKSLIQSAPEDLASIYYSARGYTYLKTTDVPPIVVKTACNVLSKAFSPDLSLENVFYILSSWSDLKCPGKLNTKEIITKVKAALNDKANTAEIYYGLENLFNMGEKITDVQKLAQILQARLKTDDSLMNFGFAFHAATRLGASGQFAYDRIEDIIVQADEIDGKMFQFEGGLGVTSLLLSGIIRLTESLKKPLPLTQIQIEKFANYLLSRRSVQTTKGISCLIEATKALTDTKLTPVCISVLGSGVVTTDKPALSVKVCDMLGKPLAQSEAVIAQSATRLADDVVVLSKQKLVATKDPTLYELEMNHKPGRYRIVVTAGAHTASLSASVLGTVNVEWLEIGVSDTDQGAPTKLQRIPYGSKLGQTLEADSQQRLVVRFSLGGKKVHQAFVRLECQQTAREIIFVAEANNAANTVYVFDMDIGSKATELGIKSGKYNIELIIGDAIINNPFRWTIAESSLRIGGAQATPSAVTQPIRGMRPEIKHMFREPEVRPAPVISTLFTALVLAPLLILFGIWMKLGINVSNFKFSLSALLFHSGLGAIFGLFFVFWLKLDMFTTCRWLLLVGLVTFLAGHRLLSSIAAQKKH